MEQGAVDLGIPGLTNAVEVARGGFSTIYRATQSTMERTVAVKLIHATVVDPVAGEHFLREVRATGRLSQHPNVAPVYDVGTTSSGQPYLLMPYYEHGSLQQRITANGALSEAEAVRLARTLAGTLDYVHNRGIVHRDVKPANVLLSESQEPLLADFGVARLVDGSVPMHTTGANVVTWAYGPPEAFTGGPPTAAWDIYSLGATVYAMLTGQPPFVDGEDVNVFTVLNRIGNVEVPDLRDRGVSPAVADAVRQTMAKEPTDRPATAAEFAALLTPLLPPPRTARTEPEPEPQPEPEPGRARARAGCVGGFRAQPEIPDTSVEEPHIEPEPEPVAVETGRARAGAGAGAVEPEPEPEPVAVALMSADSALSAEIPDTSVEEPHIEPEPVAAAFVSTDSALERGDPRRKRGRGPGGRDRRRARCATSAVAHGRHRDPARRGRAPRQPGRGPVECLQRLRVGLLRRRDRGLRLLGRSARSRGRPGHRAFASGRGLRVVDRRSVVVRAARHRHPPRLPRQRERRERRVPHPPPGGCAARHWRRRPELAPGGGAGPAHQLGVGGPPGAGCGLRRQRHARLRPLRRLPYVHVAGPRDWWSSCW